MTRFILTLGVIGLSGIIAQVILIRELLVVLCGNELVMGVILANWLLAEWMGALVFGVLSDRFKRLVLVFFGLQCLFLLCFPASLYCARILKDFLGIPFGEAVNLWQIWFSSFLILFPISFSHGALFSVSCRIFDSIAKVYAWETAGTLAGGVLFTFFLVPRCNSFQIVALVMLVNITICLFWSRELPRFLLISNIVLLGAFIFWVFGGAISWLNTS